MNALTKRITAVATAIAIAAVPAVALGEDGPLVTADWLAENLTNPDVRVFEVSVDTGVYERGHIPGAVNLAWHTDLVDTVRRDIVSSQGLEAILQAAGVTEDTTVVLYGDNNNWFAAWGAWVFDIHGIHDVKLLDGGRKLWEAEGLPLDTATPDYAASSIDLTDDAAPLRARLVDVLEVVEGGADVSLVDIRGPKEYSGEIFAPEGVQELSVRAGHIPGAVNFPWGGAVNEDGTFKSADELKAAFAAIGIDGTKPIITYCRIGERSSHTWFVLSRILGYEVRNYDGSWTEYGNAVGVPIDNPSGTVWGKI
ncbi:sulfurtransferase [Devosia sp. 63-57]|uniref:sulfurtransferase n=1 Tax=Devosia sp. 63-57 TaxID=1895751 RepID=UPI00086ABFF4|nr:sulfurtransferase [Devosia sp. 63-57]ODT48098.1 MAG: thiosulfate sulfurtransferase [Pelagibacterium sp. SCN 63-126]ODU83207.1 MAG: thiosulfate sulfurtransferase [Pelagibacterium sp. SCN 63-17]OJX42193.1 MAG: sulfurtransferase [Devosia sp. 63-57]